MTLNLIVDPQILQASLSSLFFFFFAFCFTGSVGDKSSDKEVEDMIESFSTNDYIELDHQLYGPIKVCSSTFC